MLDMPQQSAGEASAQVRRGAAGRQRGAEAGARDPRATRARPRPGAR